MTFELQEVVQRRAQKAKELHGAVRLWFIYFFIWLDLWSHLTVAFAAWVSTAYILLPYLAIHFAMAASRSSLREAIKAPLTWLVPEGGSTLHTSGCYTWVFYFVSYMLRGGCVFIVAVQVIRGNKPPNLGEQGIACDALPPWLRHPWWSSEATCPVNGNDYNRCLETLPWWRAGFLQLQGSSQRTIDWNVQTGGKWSTPFASNCIDAGGGGLEPLGHVSLLGLVLGMALLWQRRTSGRESSDAPSGPCSDQAEGTSIEVVPGKSRKRHWPLLLWHSVGFERNCDLHPHRQLSICLRLLSGLCLVLWAATGHRWFPHLPSGSSKFIVRRLPDRWA